MLEEVISDGMSFTNACKFINVHHTTFFVWMKKGRLAVADNVLNSPYLFFYNRINQAKVESEKSNVAGAIVN